MRIRTVAWSLAMLLGVAANVRGDEYSVEPLNEAPPADAFAQEIAGQLAPTGFRVARAGSPLVDIWLCKAWEVKDLKPVGDVLFPFVPGQLMGAARYARKGADFRDQDINRGVYTLRYAQQPVDGNHVGTSPTRDFLLLLLAASDKSAALLDYKALTKMSSEAAESSHPALLSMQKPQGEGLAIREDAAHEWTLVRFSGTAKAGDAAKNVVIELVVVGKAAE